MAYMYYLTGIEYIMAREFAKAFYKSKAWRTCREGYIKSVYGLCERCGQPGDEVHHKIRLTPSNINDPNVALNWDNLELLCMSCHSKEHMGNDSATKEGLAFDKDGNLIKVEQRGAGAYSPLF